MEFMKYFNELGKEDFELAGGKAANLGELTKAGFKVPPGFCVTSNTLFHIIDHNNLNAKISDIVARFNYDDFADIEAKSGQIRELIFSAKVPQEIIEEYKQALSQLLDGGDDFVAVRSSVAVKDTAISSFPGMMDTYHYLRGEDEILEHIRKCCASLWTDRAVFTRHHKGIDHRLGLISPIVQKMVFSEIAGILFTANPISKSRDEMVIESNWGLGESVVSGKSMNDFFCLDKQTLEVKDKKISQKTTIYTFDKEKGSGRKMCEVDPEKGKASTLSDEQLRELGVGGKKIEDHFGYPQDIEWAYQDGNLYFLQSRNIRTLDQEGGKTNGPKDR